MASFIGIKLADGDFYPILDEKAVQKKRLVLTTVVDGQSGVQIDLYRAPNKTMLNARYIGTLVVESISAKKKGEPSIEMIIEYSGGEISATAIDMDNKNEAERQHLSVSLQSLTESPENYDIVDDAFDSAEQSEGESVLEGAVRKSAGFDEKDRRRGVLGVVLITILLLALALFAGWFFLLNGKALFGLGGEKTVTEVSAPPSKQPAPQSKQAVPPAPPVKSAEVPQAAPQPKQPAPQPKPPAPPAKQAAPPPQAEKAPSEPVVKQPASQRARPASPVSSYNVPSSIPPEGVWYTVRWGDTLWAISEAFYRNPWNYRFLARYNGIRNPSLIISGSRIKIPPR